MNNHYALIILGAGCAGLSLASRLAALPQGRPQTLVIDQRSAFNNDRTWCFWQDAKTQGADMIQHRWTRFAVQANEARLERSCQTLPYACVTGEAFYQHTLAAIDRAEQIELQLNTAVTAVTKNPNGTWLVSTTHGQYQADAIVDTRPLQTLDAQDALLWQSFFGIEVEVDSPCFDPEVATLMAVDSGFHDGLGFVYVLPVSAQRALLEYTVFSANIYSATALQARLSTQLPQWLGGALATELRMEYGVLPMGQHQPKSSRDPSYVYAGLFAGGARASSGYAFQRIQRWATHCAQHIAAGQWPQPLPPDPRWLAWMDRIFLTVLRQHPAQAGRLFQRFFSQPPLAAIVHFMNDTPSLGEVLHIIAAMPKWLFLRTCLRLLNPFSKAQGHVKHTHA